jgi:hypothetical protein
VLDIPRGRGVSLHVRRETYVGAGPLWFELGSERLIATKWFCDSLLSYLAMCIVSTAMPGKHEGPSNPRPFLFRIEKAAYNQLATPP